jgi:hypothetical protein
MSISVASTTTRFVGMRKNSAACALRRCKYANACDLRPARPLRGLARTRCQPKKYVQLASSSRSPFCRERHEHRRRTQDRVNAEHRDRAEPKHHDRPEQPADAGRAPVLDREYCDEDAERDRQHHARERGIEQLEACDGREHRDRGCDHRVAVEQRRAECRDGDQSRRPDARCSELLLARRGR